MRQTLLETRVMKVITYVVLITFSMWSLEPTAVAARTLLEESSPTAVPTAKPAPEFSRTLEEIAEDLQSLSNDTPNQGTLKQQLKVLRQTLEELDRQIQQEFADTAKYLQEKALPAEIRQRHEAAVTSYRADLQTLLENLTAVENSDSPTLPATAKKAWEHLKQQPRKPQAPFDPNHLPFSIPDGKVRVPKETPEELQQLLPTGVKVAADTLMPGLLEVATAPGPEYLVETPEVIITPEIQALATRLEHQPVKIYNWVHDNIQFLPTYGSIQGAVMTLETKQGNAFDTASLLIALLRASGIHARYAYGTVRIPLESVMNWVGGVTKPEAAIQLLAQGGIPVVAQTQGGVIKFAKMEHVWVEAWIDFFPSRGAKHKTGDSWIPLDASFKQYQFIEGMNLQAQVPFDAADFVEHLVDDAQINETEGWVSGIDQNYMQTTLQNYQSQIETYITQTHPDATVGDVLGTQTIVPANRPVLAAGLPYQLVAKGNTFAALPTSLRHTLTVKLYDSATAQNSDSPSLVHTLALSDLTNRRLGITYIPATTDDAQLLEEYALIGTETLPVYLVKLKPVLELDGIELVSGNTVGMGQTQYYTLWLKDPETTYPLSGILNAGDEIVFGVNGNGTEPQMVSKRLEIVTSNGAAENLHQVALHYWLESDLFNELLAKLAGVHQFRLPSVGLFSSPLTIEWLFGIPRTGSYQGRAMDVKHARLAAVGPDSPTRLNFMKQAGFQGSYLEGSIFEQLFKSQRPAVSAAQFLETAAIQGISLFTLTQANVATALPLLSIEASLKDTLRQTVQAGCTVVIPQRELTLGKYTGIGYVIYDPVTGGGAYMIDGGFNGGRQGACVGSTEPQMDVIDPVVIALFGVPGSYPNLPPVWVPPPLKDPLWRKLLLRLLVATRIVAVPIPIAVGITVVLIIIAHLVRQAMMEAQLEGQMEENERCKENCASKYTNYWKCEVLTSQYPEYRYASEFAVKNELEVITGCVGAKKKNEVPATEGPCGQQKPSGARGTHIVYYHRGSNLGSVGSCPCCQDTLKGPSLKKRFSIIRLGGKMCR